MKHVSIYRKGGYAAILVALAYCTLLMLDITFRYIPLRRNVAFLQIKQTEVNGYAYYLPVFYVHVYTAIWSLFAGFSQFNTTWLRRWKGWHRRLGYVYILSVLLLAAPSGLIIGWHANGGWISRLFFSVLAILWWWFTFKAWKTVLKGDISAHRRYMMRSYALALSAITLRLWKVILVRLFQPGPMEVYLIISGLGWIPNWLFVEYILWRGHRRNKN